MRVTAQNSGFEADSELEVIAGVIAQKLQSYLLDLIMVSPSTSTMPSLASPTTSCSLLETKDNSAYLLACVGFSEPPAIVGFLGICRSTFTNYLTRILS